MTRRATFLPFSPPDITEEEIAEVVEALRSGWISTGPRVQRFEEEFARSVDAPTAVAVNSCTGAMHIALAALGVGPGDAVVVPAMAFCATANVVEHLGATPVLADVESDTLTLSPEALAKALVSLPSHLQARVVMPVHHGGHPCDMEAIEAIATEHRLAIVEDAAHALPASIEGRPVGSVGNGPVPRAVAFSFYATKNLTTAEGGMLTSAPELAEEARLWSLHGMDRNAWRRERQMGSWYYEVVRPGFKYNMTDIQAALGLVQLRRLPELHRRRQALVAHYRAGLEDVEGLDLPAESPRVTHAWHLFVVRLDLDRLTIDRDRFIAELGNRNVGSSVHFIPLHLQPFYRNRYGYSPGSFPVAFGEFERIVSLPLHTTMSERDVDDVVAAVRDVISLHRR